MLDLASFTNISICRPPNDKLIVGDATLGELGDDLDGARDRGAVRALGELTVPTKVGNFFKSGVNREIVFLCESIRVKIVLCC